MEIYIKKNDIPSIRTIFFGYSINMASTQQNNIQNEIEMHLLQDRLNKNEKCASKITSKKDKGRIFLKAKKIKNVVKNIFQNKIEQIKKNTNLLQNILAQAKKRKRLFEKELKRIAKMQNLSQNELNQIAEMHNQSRGKLEQITKIKRIKNYEEMSKEELIIFLLKSKQSIAELFSINLDDDKISDIRRNLNRLRDILPERYRKEIQKKLYEIESKKNLSEAKKE